MTVADIAAAPIDFPLRRTMEVVAAVESLPVGKHEIELHFEAVPFGKLKLKVDDSITEERPKTDHIPRDCGRQLQPRGHQDTPAVR